METVKIYLSGAMSGLSLEEMSKWRNQVTNAIKFNFECTKKPLFFDPTQYYNFEEKKHKSEREIFEFDLYNLRNSDLVIVNLGDKGDKSIGTCMELILAKELHIPVIAFGVNDSEMHPWIVECCTRICDNMKEALSHVVEFYLN